MRKFLTKCLCLSMVVSLMGTPMTMSAKKSAIKLNKKKVSLYVGKTTKLKVTGTKKKVTWKTSKKSVATVSKKGKVTAKKKGTATITAKVAKKKLICKVTVKKRVIIVKPTTTPTQKPTAVPSATPIVTPTITATPEPEGPTAVPTKTPKPTAVPADKLDSIKDACDPVFGKTGTCLTLDQLQNADTMTYVKKHYSSFTSENDMKPEAILRFGADTPLVSTKDAKTNTADYVIPANYKESTVPYLRFSNVDKLLQLAKENGMKVRAHTLVWHSQTPETFFKVGYDANGDYVTPEVMNARLEMYVRSVMNHVYTVDGGAYKDVVYAWDVLNEYLNSGGWNKDRFWSGVYGSCDDSELGTKPVYAKLAFEIAYDELKQFGLTDTVKLYSNDFNTYYNVEKEIAVADYINEGEETKICSGIGMQSHIDFDQPSVEQYMTAVKAFHDAGYDVQITEFDLTINNLEGNYKNEKQTNEDQAVHLAELMKELVAYQKETKAISGFTLWGLYDSVSWRKSSKPLLFDTGLYFPKQSYYEFMNALKG